MNKNLKQIFGVFLIGMFVLLFVRQATVYGGVCLYELYMAGNRVCCTSEELVLIGVCRPYPNVPHPDAREKTRCAWTQPSPTACPPAPTWVCPAPTRYICGSHTESYCCETDECGGCARSCSRDVPYECVGCGVPYPTVQICNSNVGYECISECFKCASFSDPLPTYPPIPTIPTSTPRPSPTPCQRCLSKAPTQPPPTSVPRPSPPPNVPTQPPLANTPPPEVESCQCIEFNFKEDKTNHKLSFECLVAGGKDTQITDYTVTFEKPGGNLVNLKSDTINPVQCPSSVAPNSACYQVKTTSVDTTVKGTYKMIVPPQIICE